MESAVTSGRWSGRDLPAPPHPPVLGWLAPSGSRSRRRRVEKPQLAFPAEEPSSKEPVPLLGGPEFTCVTQLVLLGCCCPVKGQKIWEKSTYFGLECLQS
ncbi:unnamed protein product [Natator depressus]